MHRVLLALLLLAPLAGFAKDAPFFLRDGDRVVFYGDSITDTEWYPTLVQTYVLTRYPRWRCTFYNRGQSGDNAGSLARFARDVVALRPTAFTFMMGYNDGGYQRATAAGLTKFTDNVTASLTQARAANPKVRPLLISPTPSEVVVSNDNRWVSHDYYPLALLSYSEAEAALAARQGVPFVDMTTLYGQTIGLGRVMAGDAFRLSRDGVHPQQEGQTFIAYHLLRGMGAAPALAAVTIDAKTGKAVTARCTVRDVTRKDGAFTFTRLCDSLPYPTPEVARPFSFLVRLDDTLNDDRLVVQHLPAPAYALAIDGVHLADLPADELAAGVNLSSFAASPLWKQPAALLAAVRKKDLLDCAFWRNYVTTGKADGAGIAKAPADAAEVDAARAAVDAAWQACYALNTPAPHTISLTPLEKAAPAFQAQTGRPLAGAFLDASLSALPVEWATLTANGTVKLTIGNPNAEPRSGTAAWACPAGWTVTPASAPFTVEPGKRAVLEFAVTGYPAKIAGLPTVTLRWPWAAAWPYPMTRTLELEPQPRWTAPKTRGPVAVDGMLNDWADAPRFTLDDVSFIDPAVPGKRALWRGLDDLSATFAMQWDAQNLYLSAVVRDDEHLQHESPGMMWSQDMLQVAFMMEEKGKPWARYEFGFGSYADHDAAVPYCAVPKDAAEMRFASRRDAATCTYEVAIPWSRLAPFTADVTKHFRLSFCVGDGDPQPGKGYNYLAWTPGIAYGKNPFDMAIVTLGE
jgi:lysophospholipase L1-like esterase